MEKLIENHQFATHAIAASASVSLGTALAYPLDTIKTIIQVSFFFFFANFFIYRFELSGGDWCLQLKMQVGSGPSKKLSPSQVVNRVFRFSGYSGFANLLFSLLLQAKMMYCLIGSVLFGHKCRFVQWSWMVNSWKNLRCWCEVRCLWDSHSFL